LNLEVDDRRCGQNLFWHDLLSGEYQSAQGHGTVLALHSDPANAMSDLIRFDEASTAKHVVEVRIRRQHNVSGFQPIPRHADGNRHHNCGLLTLNPNLCTGDIDPHLAAGYQFLKSL